MAAESVKFEMSFAKDQVIPQLYQIAKDLPISIKFTFGLISIWCLLKIFNSFRIYYSHRLHGTSLRETDNKGRNEFQELPVVAQEPPAIPHNIPFLGHIFGLLWNRMNYHAQINQQRHLPIYTLAVPGSKIYVVNSPELITAVQKSKTLAFAPLEVQLARRLFRPSTHGGNEMTSNTNTEKGERGLYSDGIDAIHAALLPGEGLDEMNRIAIQNIAASCDKLDSRAGAPPVRIKLMQWLRHEITMATTNSVYGPMNPFKDPKIEAEFWNFEHNIGTLIINVLPSLTARKAHLGRERMAKAFTEYFARKGHESASVLVKNRFKVCADYNLSLEDTARFEIGGVIAITVSTIPAAFWMLYYVFSKPEILALLRKEVGGVLETTNFDDTLGSITRTLNITKLRTACPLLTSTFQETLRHGALGASIRLVVEDTIISGQYLLKKDCVVQIPTHVVHFDPSIWGSSVDDFDASRFVPGHTRLTDAQGKQKKKAPPGALRPFGGGKNLCPGRHFAATEILALVSMILMRYELYVVTASDEHQHRDGEWAMPKSEKSSLAAVVREPDEDTEVEIRLREGYEEGRWAFRLDDSELVFAIDDD